MSKFYLVFCLAMALLLGYANATGLVLWNLIVPGHHEHQGPGNHLYHK